jgi:hypothetical protein
VPVKSKVIPVTGHTGLWSKTSRSPHFLDNHLKDGGEAVSLTYRAGSTLLSIPVTGHTGLWSKISRSPHFLDNQLKDVGEAVSLTYRAGSTLLSKARFLVLIYTKG